MIEYKNSLQFKTSKKMSNMGLAFNATTWSTIVSCADRFCKYDDYNWDWTLNYIFQECVKPETKTLIMSGNRAFHIGKWLTNTDLIIKCFIVCF